MGRVERQVSRLRPTFLARRSRPGAGAGLPALRIERPVPGERPAHVRQHQLRHVPRRVHAARPGELRAIRRNNPVLRRRSFFTGRAISREGVKDLAWLRPDGQEMGEEDWAEGDSHVLGMLIHGQATDEVDERGRPILGDTLFLLLNGGHRSRLFALPAMEGPGVWQEVLNTARPETGPRVVRTQAVNLVAHSSFLLRFGEDLRPPP